MQRRRSFRRVMQWDDQLADDFVEQLWQDPRGLLSQGEPLHVKLSCSVVRLNHSSGEYVYKCQDLNDLGIRIKKSLSKTTARRSMQNSTFLYNLGLPTPRPRACVESVVGPLKTRSYFLTDHVESTTLYRLMRHGNPSTECVQSIADQIADILERLDELKVAHKDLKAENVLVDPHGKVWLIDLESIVQYQRHSQRFRKRQGRDVRDLLHPRNWRSNPAAAEVVRQAICKKPFASKLIEQSDEARQFLGNERPAQNDGAQLFTVLIPSFNHAATIGECLESVRDIADEVLVVDLGSTDGTLDVIRNQGIGRVVDCAGVNLCEALETARQQAAHPWILQVHANERLNPELGRQVQHTLIFDPDKQAYTIGTTPCLQGTHLRYGGFERTNSIRLYGRNLGSYAEVSGVAELQLPAESVGAISSRLAVHTPENPATYISSRIAVSSEQAKTAFLQGERSTRLKLLWRTHLKFLGTYLRRSGWRDGWAGLHACLLASLDTYVYEQTLLALERSTPLVTPVREESRKAA